jgi:hypothetical protein
MKYKLQGIALAVGLSLGGLYYCNSRPTAPGKQIETTSAQFIALRDSPLDDIKWLPNLAVNTEPYRTGKKGDFRLGVIDMQMLAETEKSEEAWIYDDVNHTWIEVGLEASEKLLKERNAALRRPDHYVSLSQKIDYDYLNQYITNIDIESFEFWHYHPAHMEKITLEALRKHQLSKGKPWDDLAKKSGNYLSSVANSIPSQADLYEIINAMSIVHKKFPEAELRAGVVSKYGFVEVTLTETGNELLLNVDAPGKMRLSKDIYGEANLYAYEFLPQIMGHDLDSEHVRDIRHQNSHLVCENMDNVFFNIIYYALD